MAVYNSSEKRHAQSERRRIHNKALHSEVRTSVKKFLQFVTAGSKADAQKQYLETQQLLDSGVRKGIFHINTASRTKSRLTQRLNKMGAS